MFFFNFLGILVHFVPFSAHFECEIQNGQITMKFYLQVFHSNPTKNNLLKYAIFIFGAFLWAFLGYFGPFLAHFGCEIKNGQITMKFYLQVFHSYSTKNILIKYAFFFFWGHFSPFWTFLAHFGCEIQNDQITMKFYLQVFHSYPTIKYNNCSKLFISL